jgi:hypothetical protein
MNKLVHSLGLMVALAATSMLAGCELYFGSHDHGDGSTWNYCGSDGYYQCHGDSCSWVSATCPDPGTSPPPGNYECTASTDCAAGCYCQNGTCEEGGFCATDSDCGDGYHCNTDRSSCEPNPPGCQADSDCGAGQTCDVTSGACTATCICGDDASAVSQGFGYCDETRQTCMTGTDPNGTCAGTPGSSCTTAAPQCPAGQVPLMGADGCFTGACEAYASCSAAPVCEHINDEDNCLSRNDCGGNYTGHNCHKADGTACHDGDSGCTCESFTFASCSSEAPN